MLFCRINATIKCSLIVGGFYHEYRKHCIAGYSCRPHCRLDRIIFSRQKGAEKRDEQEAQLAANAQTVSMLIIDKKRMRLKDSGLPQVVIDQTPKMMRHSKLPIVKAKVGPKVMSLIADEAVYDLIPLKKEVKATVSGIYITKVTGVRGPLEKPQGKKSFRARMQEKAKKANAELEKEKAELAKEKAAKKKKK